MPASSQLHMIPKSESEHIHSLSYHELTTHSQSVGAGARQSAGEMRCTTFLSSAMSVLSGVGAVEVDVGTAHESTVLELFLAVNGRSIKVEEEGVDIQRASRLSEKSANVLQQHLTRHSLVSLAW